MTVSSVTEILTPKTADELVTEQLAVMAAEDPPLPTTAWQPGSVPLTLIDADCAALEDEHATVALLGASAFLGTAERDWLTLRAKSTFDLDRLLATYTIGSVTLTCASGAGPETITPGALVLTLPDGKQYRSTNTSNVTVPSGGSTPITVRAEGAGADYNGALTGVTIVTPAAAGLSVSAASGLSWITTTARNEESDADLRTRCRARWATLATAGCGTRDSYVYNVLSALMPDGVTSCGATRVGFLSPAGDGTVPIRVTGSSGLLTDDQRDGIRAWIDVRRPITDTPQIEHASTVAVNLTGSTVRFKSGFNTDANRTLVKNAVRNHINALPMGTDLESAFLDEAELASAIYASVPGGFADVDLTCGDVTIPEGTIATVDETVIVFS